MIPGWALATLAAAALQTWRTAMQQKLRGRLTPNGAGFVRYAFGAPWSVLAVFVIVMTGRRLPTPGLPFFWTIALGGIAQIAGTNMLIRSFTLRDFAIGTAYAKTEALQAALISALFIGDALGWRAWIGFVISLVGVVVLAVRGDMTKIKSILGASGDRAMWAGLAAGTGFGVASVCIRSASNSLGHDQPVVRALMTLAIMNTIQLVINGAWLGVAQRAELGAVAKAWKQSAVVGFLSVAGSAGWAIALTLQKPGLVKSLGQLDLVFAFLVGRYAFHEDRRRSEYVGSAIVVIGVVLVLLR